MEVGSFEFTVTKIFIHASYNQPKFANDIAIVELDKEGNDEINDAVCLPESTIDAVSSIAIVKRAGIPLNFGRAQSVLHNECSLETTTGQFCSKVQSNETHLKPFIGAVVMESDQNRQYTFKGFTSSLKKRDDSKPFIFTDISYHLNWIHVALGNLFQNNTNVVESIQNLPTCQMSNGNGYCVELHQCSFYRNAPKPYSQRHIAYLEQVKCVGKPTSQNNIEEDNLCCPQEYIELNYKDENDQKKRGVELLDFEKCGQVGSSRRIVGGSKAGLKEFPWIGLIKYRVGKILKFTCGSSLISQKYVLTCAHCITSLPRAYEVVGVRLGEYNRTSDPDCRQFDQDEEECNPPVQDIEIEKLIPHPKYNTPRYANDVGLVRLAREPDMTEGN